MELSGRDRELLRRGVQALEKIASDPVIEYSAGPPICPHCGKHDPHVRFDASDGGEGPLSEISIDCYCIHCGQRMWIVIESYSMHRDRETAMAEIIERKERAGNEDG